MRRLVTKADRLAARYIPKNAYCVTLTDARAAYCYPAAGKFVALCYRGSAARPEVHVSCKDLDSATATIANWLLGVQSSEERKAKDAAEKAAWTCPVQVGQIYYTSWGYDQTNTDFYIVTRVSGRRVWVRSIAQDTEATGWASGKCWPKMPIELCGEESMHIAQPSGKDARLVIDGHHASLEQGRSHHFSTYA